MEFTLEKFNAVKREAETMYASLGKIRCPYFADDVHFNAKGLEHLIFKQWNRTRPINDQFVRLRHLALAPEIIRQSKTLQGIWSTQKLEKIKKNGRWEKVLKSVMYYEFIAVMESHGSPVRVKVVVKQVAQGERQFLSIIPFWGVE